jgi:NTP pyrophosphatase (non-canonical NTP hydrolase)
MEMELRKCQEDVNSYFDRLDSMKGAKKWPRFVSLARLNEEIAEIARIISVEEGYRQRWKVDNMNFTDEFGDALFQLIHLANECNVDLEESWDFVMKKYEKYLYKKD